MLYNISGHDFQLEIPDGFIVFISGVPGVGKTTISYELLRRCDKFRIVEESDLIREILRGYNELIKDTFGNEVQFLFDKIEIFDHMKFLTYDDAKRQCEYMKKSIEKIVARQQRKGIATIINGVHIIPEMLDGIVENHNVMYVNLYISSINELYSRLKERNAQKYTIDNISLIYQTNIELYSSVLNLAPRQSCLFNNVDVTNASVDDTINEVFSCISRRIAAKS